MNSVQKIKIGFPPVFNEQSKVLILGSFPSVKSREISFYYGNKQNRFWKMLCGFFGEEIPSTNEGKKVFLFKHGVALWDIALSCEIQGSSDASIKNAEIANLSEILSTAKIEKILLNGTLASELFLKKYANINIPFKKMPSTSPANPRYNQGAWWSELNEIFAIRTNAY
jgi:hypoxanthine-DNA glycosylase